MVEAYFPASYTISPRGSHFLIVRHEALLLAEEHGFSANFPGGRLSISHTGGKHVRAYLIRHLLEAIDLKEAFDKANEE